tara:strand:- start:4152 stop:4757 length:606 start_codon:yes stop_codon:yes gene_type:complete
VKIFLGGEMKKFLLILSLLCFDAEAKSIFDFDDTLVLDGETVQSWVSSRSKNPALNHWLSTLDRIVLQSNWIGSVATGYFDFAGEVDLISKDQRKKNSIYRVSWPEKTRLFFKLKDGVVSIQDWNFGDAQPIRLWILLKGLPDQVIIKQLDLSLESGDFTFEVGLFKGVIHLVGEGNLHEDKKIKNIRIWKSVKKTIGIGK